VTGGGVTGGSVGGTGVALQANIRTAKMTRGKIRRFMGSPFRGCLHYTKETPGEADQLGAMEGGKETGRLQ
jgi:hypothetical protein